MRYVSEVLLREKIYAELRDQIVDGVLAPGDVLQLNELAERLRVSRTPVREALRRLEDERLVETVASRWTRVAPLDIGAAVQMYPIRWALDSVAIRTTESFPAAALQQMRDANARLADAVSRGDRSAAHDADHEFHLALIGPCGNAEIVAMVEMIRLRLLRFAKAYWAGGATGMQSLAEHAGVIDLLAEGNRDGAAQGIEQHWQNSLRRMQVLHHPGLPNPPSWMQVLAGESDAATQQPGRSAARRPRSRVNSTG